MPDELTFTVRILRDPNNRRRCLVVPKHFGARLGDTLEFVHHTDLPPVHITFRNNSAPFTPTEFDSGSAPHKVEATGQFTFDVRWNEPEGPGQGNGSGEVPPG